MYSTIFLEVIGGFFILFFIVKFLGKTQISQITPFDFISALVLGELVGNAIYDPETNFGIILFASTVWGCLIYLTEMATQKSMKLRRLFEGEPSMIIKKGRLEWRELKRNRLDINQLQQLLRAKGVFSVQDIEYAILENNGAVSVLRKADADSPTCQDLKLQAANRMIPYTIISDGDVLRKNLEEAGKSEDWLRRELQKQGAEKPEEISYAEYMPGSSLFIQRY